MSPIRELLTGQASPQVRRRFNRKLITAGLAFWLAAIGMHVASSQMTAHPIFVVTDSISTGIYWLDTTAHDFRRGEFATFHFHPKGGYLAKRYAPARHTKYLLGLPGDTVWSDAEGHLRVCKGHEPHVSQIDGPAAVVACWEAGATRKLDSLGRPMKPWLAPGKSYVLGAGEYWDYGPNVKSLDARYTGPVKAADIMGKATPLWIWEDVSTPQLRQLAIDREKTAYKGAMEAAVPQIPSTVPAVHAASVVFQKIIQAAHNDQSLLATYTGGNRLNCSGGRQEATESS